MVAFTKFALACAALIPGASASAFLKSKNQGNLGQVTLDIIESTLLAELSTDSARTRQFENELRSMYLTLPKNEYGTLEPAAVRYALHRYFVQKHGWYVKGLEPAGQSWNSTGATDVMKTRVPLYIQSLFEKRAHGKGLGLHDLAVFAATMADFVQNEALADVMDLYAAFKIPTTTVSSKHDVDLVMRAYILQLLDNYTITSMQEFHESEQYMIEDYPDWENFQMWVEDLRQTAMWSRSSLAVQDYTLESVVHEVISLNENLGKYQDISCKTLKGGLVDIEYKNTGRVLLTDFYREGLKGEFLFIEHADFLRKLGALDESDPKHPSVIIANYLASQANCLASTSFHSVCCIDECEGLMGSLERSIAAPTASVDRIAGLVAQLHSDTVDAPRNLSTSLISRLQEIADVHDGVVPLHGRLFAQWMHHAYPLECPFPHMSGTTAPLTPDEWMDAFGVDEVAVPEDERRNHVKSAEGRQAPEMEALPWTAVEELVVPHKRPVQQKGLASRLGRKLGAFLAVAAVAVPIARAAKAFVVPCQEVSDKAHVV